LSRSLKFRLSSFAGALRNALEMIFIPTKLKGAWVIDLERHEDERGFFARTWCVKECESHGLAVQFLQSSVSFNKKKGTLRGMHFQVGTAAETKLVRCTRGAIFDVIVDLRPNSKTFLQWEGVELTEDSGRAFYIPQGFAHGFQTLSDSSEVYYQMSAFYAPGFARGFRWNDPAIGIKWPDAVRTMALRDQQYPDFSTEICQFSQ
jgi:dTDP-4-dehydrorhamnose 3,5-epimerase